MPVVTQSGGEFNNVSVGGRSFCWYLSLLVMCIKPGISTTSTRGARIIELASGSHVLKENANQKEDVSEKTGFYTQLFLLQT